MSDEIAFEYTLSRPIGIDERCVVIWSPQGFWPMVFALPEQNPDFDGDDIRAGEDFSFGKTPKVMEDFYHVCVRECTVDIIRKVLVEILSVDSSQITIRTMDGVELLDGFSLSGSVVNLNSSNSLVAAN